MSTCKKSGKRLDFSLIRDDDLEFSKVTIADPTPEQRSCKEKFWEFYHQNPDLDRIVSIQSFKVFRAFKSIPAGTNLDDIRDSVLVRFHEKQILAIWNPKLSSIATFLTNHAYFYAKKTLNALISKEPYYRGEEKVIDRVIGGVEEYHYETRRKRCMQKLYGDLNNMPVESEDETSVLGDSTFIMSEIENKDLLSVLRTSLRPGEKKVFDLVMKDRSLKEMQEDLSREGAEVTEQYIKSTLSRIHRKAKALDSGLHIRLKPTLDRSNLMPVAGKNGHKKRTSRPLNKEEKKGLYNLYVKLDGIVDWDTLTEYRLKEMSPSVGPYQPSGYFSYLHRLARTGRIKIRNRSAYNANRISRGQEPLQV